MALVHLCSALVVVFSGASGCEDKPFEEPMELGGKTIEPEVLNRGHEVYRRHCIACHGEEGDGDGPSAAASTPRPRDFTRSVFKFKSTPGDALPLDADLERTIVRGLEGTNMNAVDLDDDDLHAVVQYIKTFGDRWKREDVPEAVDLPSDPWSGKRERAIARGKLLYHGVAACWQCHPAYMEEPALRALIEREDPIVKADDIESSWRPNLGEPVEVESAFGKLLPPDFYGGTLRAARTGADFYRTVAAGIGGTKMPAFSERLSSEDVWALAHYVRELKRLGDLRRHR